MEKQLNGEVIKVTKEQVIVNHMNAIVGKFNSEIQSFQDSFQAHLQRVANDFISNLKKFEEEQASQQLEAINKGSI